MADETPTGDQPAPVLSHTELNAYFAAQADHPFTAQVGHPFAAQIVPAWGTAPYVITKGLGLPGGLQWTIPAINPAMEVGQADSSTADVVRARAVLAVEGVPSGDGRMIRPGALTWRDLPLPLMLKTSTEGEAHSGATLSGAITDIMRVGNQAWADIVIDMGSASGQELRRLMTPMPDGTIMLRGVSVDLDSVAAEWIDDPDWAAYGGRVDLTRGRIMGATACVMPALQEATIALLASASCAIGGEACDCPVDATIDALVASAGAPGDGVQARIWTPWTPTLEPLVASAGKIPVNPPAAWFERQTYTEATPILIDADGRISGHVAGWKSAHISFRHKVTAPHSYAQYRYFANKHTLTAEGTMVYTGPLMMDTVHPDLKMQASDAQAFYAHTGSVVGDVCIYEDEHGIAIQGAARPTATPGMLRAARGSDVSPDWRPIEGQLELVALLACNTSGFITPALAASAGDNPIQPGHFAISVDFETGNTLALVAAGGLVHEDKSAPTSDDRIDRLEGMVEAIVNGVTPLITEKMTARAEAAVSRGGFQTVGQRAAELAERLAG